jgi:hypothetical protein
MRLSWTGTLRDVLAWVVVGLGVALLVIPTEAKIAPPIRVRVLDTNGKPASNVVVQQSWGFHSVASQSVDTKRTDGEGYVSFPARSVWRPWTVWVVAMPFGLLSHSGWGEHAALWAYGSDPQVWTTQNCGVKFTPPVELRLQRRNVTMYPER